MLTLALRQKGLLCMCAVSPRNLSLTSSSATDFYIQVGRGVSHFLLQGHGLGGGRGAGDKSKNGLNSQVFQCKWVVSSSKQNGATNPGPKQDSPQWSNIQNNPELDFILDSMFKFGFEHFTLHSDFKEVFPETHEKWPLGIANVTTWWCKNNSNIEKICPPPPSPPTTILLVICTYKYAAQDREYMYFCLMQISVRSSYHHAKVQLHAH